MRMGDVAIPNEKCDFSPADRDSYAIHEGNGPLVAAAIHNGHDVRPEVREHLALSDAERLREEDPFTAEWTAVAPTRIIGNRSRFEVDLNRPRHQAVYRKPEDSWGLEVWKESLPPHVIDGSLAVYDAFYDEVKRLFARKSEDGPFLVYDLHSNNHRRAGPDHPPEGPELNPEVNVGTGTMNRKRWAPGVDRFIDALRSVEIGGRRLDVRENVKFRGGFFAEWTHATFPETGCALAIEFKKTFMDEWTGEPNRVALLAVRDALAATVEPVLEALHRAG